MANQPHSSKSVDPTCVEACRYGKWTSILIALSAFVAFAIAITTAPARSGPNCPPLVDMGVISSCVTYPFTDVAAYVPVEYIWMYPAILLSLLFVVLVMSIYDVNLDQYRVAARIAMGFSIVSAAVHSVNYFIQLAVVQPSLVKGETDSLILFSQYNPHGIFIALEDLGYFLMGLTFGFISFSFIRPGKLVKAIRYIFSLSSIVIVMGLPLMAILYRSDLEYRYEVLSLALAWVTLIITGVLLFFYFRRIERSTSE